MSIVYYVTTFDGYDWRVVGKPEDGYVTEAAANRERDRLRHQFPNQSFGTLKGRAWLNRLA